MGNGCGDGQCVVERPKGRHTNGGCKCLLGLDMDTRLRVRRALGQQLAQECLVIELRAEVGQLRERAEQAEAQVDTVGEHLGCDRDGRDSEMYLSGILHVIDTEWCHVSGEAERLSEARRRGWEARATEACVNLAADEAYEKDRAALPARPCSWRGHTQPADGRASPRRPCGLCKLPERADGHDACMGVIPGAMNACCGHGDPRTAYIQPEPGGQLDGVAQDRLRFRAMEFAQDALSARAEKAEALPALIVAVLVEIDITTSGTPGYGWAQFIRIGWLQTELGIRHPSGEDASGWRAQAIEAGVDLDGLDQLTARLGALTSSGEALRDAKAHARATWEARRRDLGVLAYELLVAEQEIWDSSISNEVRTAVADHEAAKPGGGS